MLAAALMTGGPSVEQTSQGSRPPVPIVASFDGLGVGFASLQPSQDGRNPSDNSLAVGPESHRADRELALGDVHQEGRDVRYHRQAALRRRADEYALRGIRRTVRGAQQRRRRRALRPAREPLAVRHADLPPAGERFDRPRTRCATRSARAPTQRARSYRYEFKRPLFPDYPRPAVWPDGYYIPTSTSDDFIQKHVCVVEREKMLKGLPAREQCIVIDGVNFLNNADVDGQAAAAGGSAEHHDGRRRGAAEQGLRGLRHLLLEVPRRLERHHEDETHRPR